MTASEPGSKGRSQSIPDPVEAVDDIVIIIPDDVSQVGLLGHNDCVLRSLERCFPHLDLLVRGNELHFSGTNQQIEEFSEVLAELFAVVRKGQELTPDAVQRAIAMMQTSGARPGEVLTKAVLSHAGGTIRPKTENQREYVDAIDGNTVVFGVGPAGTGKTYLAMAKAIDALHAKKVKRIILTRPAVEAGEKLGFLPGTLTEKIDPYLRPLYDALHDMINPDSIPRLMSSGTIEVAPLAYMRGRTLNDAFIILDEAQNTTKEQMKMFLTRLGFGSKMVVTGDISQVDLPRGVHSGLRIATKLLADVEDVAVVSLTATDVVRHRLVGDIVRAYEAADGATPYDQEAQ